MAILECGGVALPAPTELSSDDEIIWNSSSGRSASGKFVGDVIAEKKKLVIKWGILTETEIKKIKDNMIAGFFPIKFREFGKDITVRSYRGTLSKEHLGKLSDGNYYYKSASVEIIQQ